MLQNNFWKTLERENFGGIHGKYRFSFLASRGLNFVACELAIASQLATVFIPLL